MKHVRIIVDCVGFLAMLVTLYLAERAIQRWADEGRAEAARYAEEARAELAKEAQERRAKEEGEHAVSNRQEGLREPEAGKNQEPTARRAAARVPVPGANNEKR